MVIYEHDKECTGKVKFISIVTFKPENRFWYSDTPCDNEGIEWQIYQSDLPDKYKIYAADIDRVFNENVEFGCCGGCF